MTRGMLDFAFRWREFWQASLDEKAGTKTPLPLCRSSLGLGAIQRETLNDRVYQQLRTMIMSGRVRPGKELKLRELAKELHVSLMPVRDAIGRLVVERALDMLPNRQVIVPELSLDRLLEVRRVRVVLESEAARWRRGMRRPTWWIR